MGSNVVNPKINESVAEEVASSALDKIPGLPDFSRKDLEVEEPDVYADYTGGTQGDPYDIFGAVDGAPGEPAEEIPQSAAANGAMRPQTPTDVVPRPGDSPAQANQPQPLSQPQPQAQPQVQPSSVAQDTAQEAEPTRPSWEQVDGSYTPPTRIIYPENYGLSEEEKAAVESARKERAEKGKDTITKGGVSYQDSKFKKMVSAVLKKRTLFQQSVGFDSVANFINKDMTGYDEETKKFGNIVNPETVPEYVPERARKERTKEVTQRSIFYSDEAGSKSFYGTILGDHRLNPSEISYGLEDLRSLHERGVHPEFVLDILEQTELDEDFFLNAPQSEVVSELNAALKANKFRAMLEKFPTTAAGDQAAFYLQVHEGRGVAMNPFMSKLANADFDGDAGRINLKSVTSAIPNATEIIGGMFGRASVDDAFIPLPEDNEGKITEVLTSNLKVSAKVKDGFKNGFKTKDYAMVAEAVNELAALNFKDRYDRAQFAGKTWSEIYKLGRIQYSEGIVHARGNHHFHTAYQQIESLPNGDAESKIKDLLSGCLSVRRLPNYAELKDALNSNLEWQPGKNYEYRIAADFAKYARRTDNITFDSDGFAYFNEEGASDLYDGLVEHLVSLYMSSMSELEPTRQGQKQQLVETVLTTAIPGEADLLRRYGFFELPEKDFVVDENAPEVPDLGRGYWVPHRLHPRDFFTPEVDVRKPVTDEIILEAREENPYWIGPIRNRRGSLVNPTGGSVCWPAFCAVVLNRYRFYASKIDAAASIVFDDGSVQIGKRWGLKETDDGSIDNGTYSKVIGHLYPDILTGDFLFGHEKDAKKAEKYESYSERFKGIEPHLQDKLIDTMTKNDFYVHGSTDGKKKTWMENGTAPEGEDRKDYGILGSGPLYTSEVIDMLFDHKSFASSQYTEHYMKATEDAWAWLKEFRSHLGSDLSKDWEAIKLLENGVEGLNYLSPEIYTGFGVGSTRDFLSSPTGKALLSAKSSDDLRNIDLILKIKKRLDRINEAQSRLNMAEEVDEIQIAQDRLIEELDSLASSSPTWRALAEELVLNNGGSINIETNEFYKNGEGTKWQQLKKDLAFAPVHEVSGKKVLKVTNSRGAEYQAYFDAPNIILGSKHATIFDFLASHEVSYGDKISVLSDFTKYATGSIVRQTEVQYYLSKDRQTIFGDTRYLSRDGFSQDIEYFKEASNRFNRYTKGRDDSVAQLEKLLVKFNGDKKKASIAIQRKLNKIAGGEPVARVPLLHLADAMKTCLRKASSDAEKNQQQKVMSGLYNAVSLVKNGFVPTEWRAVTDIAIGRMSYDDLVNSPLLLLKILANPKLSVTVYNNRGIEEKISRSILIPDESGGNLYDFFEEHPGLVMAMRAHETNFMNSGDGKAFTQATSTFAEFVTSETSAFDLAMDALVDNPGFYAIVASMTNIKGITSRDSSIKYMNSIQDSVHMLAKIALTCDLSDETKFREDVERLAVAWGNKHPLVLSRVWDQKRSRLVKHMLWCAEDLRAKFTELHGEEGFSMLSDLSSLAPGKVTLLPNKTTLHTVEDAEQMFYGAKTAMTTSANGAMSQEIGSIVTMFADSPEACEVEARPVTASEIRENPEKYIGMNTTKGYFSRLDILNIIVNENNITEPFYVYDPADCKCGGVCCKNHSPHDGSSARRRTQSTVLAAFCQLIRTDSTEAHSLKSKKVGFDELTEENRKNNSIVKFDIVSRLKDAVAITADHLSVEDIAKERYKNAEEISPGSGKAAATEYVSKVLRDALTEMDYKTMKIKVEDIEEITVSFSEGLSESQLKAIAYSMIREENGSVRLVSIRAAASEVNANIDPRGFRKREEFIAAQRELFANAGKAEGKISDVLLRQLKRCSKKRTLQSMERTESSDWGRNYSKISELSRALGNKFNFDPWIERKIKKALWKEFDPGKPWVIKKDGKRIFSREWKSFLRNWRVQGVWAPGCFLSKDGKERLALGSFAKMIGGPANCYLILGEKLPDEKQMQTIYGECKERGISLAMDPKHYKELLKKLDDGDKLIENVNTINPYGLAILPLFEMALNGESNTADQSLTPIGVKRAHPGEFVRLIETVAAEFLSLGDSNVAFTSSMSKRFRFFSDGKHKTALDDAFGFINQSGDYKNKHYELLSWEETELLLNSEYGAAVELGVTPSEKNKQRFEEMFERWRSRRDSIDERTGMLKEAYPGEIIGFVRCIATVEVVEDNRTHTVEQVFYSPIIPYDAKEKRGSVEFLTIDNVSIDRASNEIVVWWSHEKKLGENMFFKIFEGIHSANKMIAHIFLEAERFLFNGLPVDCFVWAKSTESRRTGTLMRDCMHTMICEARHSRFTKDIGEEVVRMDGYNAAESPSFLSENADGLVPGGSKTRAELKEEILRGKPNLEFWMEFFKNLDEKNNLDEENVYMFYDSTLGPEYLKVNKFLTTTLRRCTEIGVDPTIFLASRIVTEEGTMVDLDLYFRYDALLSESKECQDGLMAWFNHMMPWICPQNNEAKRADDFMFIPSELDGALVTKVPHKDSEGNDVLLWEHMFTSIPTFSKDTSAQMRTSIQKGWSSPSSLQNRILTGHKASMAEIFSLHDWYRAKIGDNTVGIRPLMEDDSEIKRLEKLRETIDNLEITDEVDYGWWSSEAFKKKLAAEARENGEEPDTESSENNGSEKENQKVENTRKTPSVFRGKPNQ